jgi:hypothetical protein
MFPSYAGLTVEPLDRRTRPTSATVARKSLLAQPGTCQPVVPRSWPRVYPYPAWYKAPPERQPPRRQTTKAAVGDGDADGASRQEA